MTSPREWTRRVWGSLVRTRRDRDLESELEAHLELAADELERRGRSREDAQRVARLQAGGVTPAMEALRDQRGIPWLEDLVRDLRHGCRTLLRQPGFVTVVVLTLGIGVGGSAAIFGAVNGILLKPLPYADADRVLAVWQHDRPSGNDRQEVAPANFLDWRERNRSFETLTAMEPYGLDWRSPDGPVYLSTWLVYEGFFDVFRTSPLLGRTFRADEHEPGRGDVVILGHALWRQRFGGAEDVVGRVLTLDDRPHTVVGVMPPGFAMPSDEVLWAPKVLEGWEAQNRTSAFYTVFGRLRAGVTIEQATADLDRVAAQLSREYPRTNAGTSVAVVPLPEHIVGGIRRTLWLLLGSVALVLAVVAATLASLQLARATARAREFSVRAALGAGQGRLARQLAAESLVLAAIGTGVGFGAAHLALNGIRALAPADVPRITELGADRAVLVFAGCLSALLAMSSGIMPMVLGRRTRLQAVLTEGGRSVAGGRLFSSMQAGLVVLQCGACLMLLVAAGLLIRSFVAVLSEPAGFRTDGVVVLTVQTWGHYSEGPARAAFVQEVLERLSSSPGVAAAGMTSSVPLMETIGTETAPMTVEGAPPVPEGESLPLVHYTITAGDFFEALSIQLLQGRLFDARDRAASAPVALINQTLAKQFFADGDPLGRRLLLTSSGGGAVSREIVGVVGDVRRFGLHEAARPAVYVPHAQSPTGANAFIVRGEGRPADLLQQTRRTMWQLNPALAVYREDTMEDLVGDSVRERQFVVTLLSGFAAMALALAATGIFGLMSFVTSRRTREYGIRLALGAPRRELFASVLTRGLALSGLGMGLGLVGALAVTRMLGAMLYEVTPFDPPAFVASVLVLCATAAVASAYPAARAARINLSDVIRQE